MLSTIIIKALNWLLAKILRIALTATAVQVALINIGDALKLLAIKLSQIRDTYLYNLNQFEDHKPNVFDKAYVFVLQTLTVFCNTVSILLVGKATPAVRAV